MRRGVPRAPAASGWRRWRGGRWPAERGRPGGGRRRLRRRRPGAVAGGRAQRPGAAGRTSARPGGRLIRRSSWARRVRRSTSSRSTPRGSSRSQPRFWKSASALLTVSREAPTSWASSSWVRSCDHVDRCRPAAPRRTRGQVEQRLGDPAGDVGEDQVGHRLVGPAQPLGQRLQQRAGHLGAAGEPRAEVVVTEPEQARVGERAWRWRCAGPGSNSESSPNISPGPRTPSRVSRPSLEVAPSLILPSVTTYSRSPGLALGEERRRRGRGATCVIEARSAAAASSSSAAKSGAWRARRRSPSLLGPAGRGASGRPGQSAAQRVPARGIGTRRGGRGRASEGSSR